jgi:hypothetical protein
MANVIDLAQYRNSMLEEQRRMRRRVKLMHKTRKELILSVIELCERISEDPMSPEHIRDADDLRTVIVMRGLDAELGGLLPELEDGSLST